MPCPPEAVSPCGNPGESAMDPGFNVLAPFEVTAPADFDDDGVPDESDAFPADPDESADHDGDGRTNRQEYEAGTAARDGSSFFRIDSMGFPSPGQIELTWHGIPGRNYGIWRWNFFEQTSELLVPGISVSSPQPISRTVASSSLSDFSR